MGDAKDFKQKVKALGGVFRGGEHIYFSSGRDWYSASYMPAYPEDTPRDLTIMEHWAGGKCDLTAWNDLGFYVWRYKDWNDLAANFIPPAITKAEAKKQLLSEATLCDLFRFEEGQECEIFKAGKFVPGDTVLYIPDICLNDIPVDRVLNEKEVEEVLECCYTGDDFIDECGGDIELAERLFWYVDWQHPSSAYPEVCDDEEEE